MVMLLFCIKKAIDHNGRLRRGRGTRTRTQTCGFGDHRANH